MPSDSNLLKIPRTILTKYELRNTISPYVTISSKNQNLDHQDMKNIEGGILPESGHIITLSNGKIWNVTPKELNQEIDLHNNGQ